ncbi:MAG: hypothetical protein J7K36_04360 [Archaeoglobaceae archaeon]|nr:hypothetical protein [Archaeoglobaceae archaeon]
MKSKLLRIFGDKYLTILVLALTLPMSVSASEPVVEWQKTFGGSSWDEAYSVQQTSDGGYIIAGSTLSYGSGEWDVYLIKTDSDGNLEWQKTFGGPSCDIAYSVQQTNDGGYIIAGKTYSYGSIYSDVYLIKTDKNGNLQWQKTFDKPDWDEAISVKQTSDSGYIIAGRTWECEFDDWNVFLLKTDKNGNIKWWKTIGSWDVAISAQQTSDDGYIIVGRTLSYWSDNWDVYVLKLDKNGNREWWKTLGGSMWDEARSVQQTNDGGYVIARVTWSYGSGHSDVYLIKLSP